MNIENETQLKRKSNNIHMNPNRSHITVKEKSPVVVLKKIELGRSGELDRVLQITSIPEPDDDGSLVDDSIQKVLDLHEGGAEHSRYSDKQLAAGNTKNNKNKLENYIEECVQMNAENKITQKNAFGFQLIDFMKFALQSKKDISTMAYTLDAGTKIYSCKVDSLYHQVIKLANEVSRYRVEKKIGNSGESQEQSNENLKKEKRKGNKKNMIVSYESLNRKLIGKDPKDEYIKVDALPGAIIATVRKDPKTLALSLDNNLPFWQNWEGYKPLRAEGTMTMPAYKIFRGKPKQTCKKEELLPLSQIQPIPSNTVVDNINITPKAFQIPPQEAHKIEDESIDSHFDEPITDYVEDNHKSVEEKDVGVISTVTKRLNEKAEAKIPSRLEAMKILFRVSSDYHYLDMRNAHYWAGPQFWKRPRVGIQYNQENKDRKKIQKKNKKLKEISYDCDTVDVKWNELFKKGCKETKNRCKTILTWRNNQLTLPVDLKIEKCVFLNLFQISSVNVLDNTPESTQFVNVTVNEEGNGSSSNSSHEINSQELSNPPNSPDTLNSAFYKNVPGSVRNSYGTDSLNSTYYKVTMLFKYEDPQEKDDGVQSGKVINVQISTSESPTFGESFLVPAPKIIKFKPIKYSTRPINVDMQQLKMRMMEVIRQDIEEDTRKKQADCFLGPSQSYYNCKPQTKFSSILHQVQSELERSAADLSPAMAFQALLTLANENNLQIENNENYSDVTVSFEDKSMFCENSTYE